MNRSKLPVSLVAIALGFGCGTHPSKTPQGSVTPGPVPDPVETEINPLEQMQVKAGEWKEIARHANVSHVDP